MSPLSLIPSSWKLYAAGIAVVGLLGTLGAAAAVIDKHGYDKAAAVLQPQLDAAHQAVGILTAANATDEATIIQMKADAVSNETLISDYEQQIDDLNQQAADAGAAIRKVQNDDPSVDAYMRAPIPAALRGLLAGSKAGASGTGPANQADHGTPAKAVPVPAVAR